MILAHRFNEDVRLYTMGKACVLVKRLLKGGSMRFCGNNVGLMRSQLSVRIKTMTGEREGHLEEERFVNG